MHTIFTVTSVMLLIAITFSGLRKGCIHFVYKDWKFMICFGIKMWKWMYTHTHTHPYLGRLECIIRPLSSLILSICIDFMLAAVSGSSQSSPQLTPFL